MAKVPAFLEAARAKWRYRGDVRPPFAAAAQPGQESVWDYPRPPRLAADQRVVVVRAGETLIARTTRAVRVLETASPPTFYLPPDDVHTDLLAEAPGSSLCEWKGEARYWTVAVPGSPPLVRAAWSYDDPYEGFKPLAGYFSFYPALVACYVGDARVTPQPGKIYGGWITPEVVGPFKGEPGTEGW